MERHLEENRLFVPKKNSRQVDYDNELDEDWTTYVHRNLSQHAGKDSPYPGSFWSYSRGDSVFNEESSLGKKSDDTIYEEVTEALYLSQAVDASGIEVNVLNGIVSLLGHVKDMASKDAAVKIVEHLPGVWDVHNQISIET